MISTCGGTHVVLYIEILLVLYMKLLNPYPNTFRLFQSRAESFPLYPPPAWWGQGVSFPITYWRTEFIPQHFWEAAHIQHISTCNQLSVLSNLMVWLSAWKPSPQSHSSPYTPRGIASYHGDHSNPLPTLTSSWSTTSESSHNQKLTMALGFTTHS